MTDPRLSINSRLGTTHKVPPAVSVALQSLKGVSTSLDHNEEFRTHPNADVERIVGKWEDATIQGTEKFTGAKCALNNRPVSENNAL
jgi:hypothetical protein